MESGSASRRLLWAALLLGTVASASACSSDETPRSTGEHERQSPSVVHETVVHRPAIDGDMIRGHVHDDYDLATSVSEAARRTQVVAVGTVVSWSEGRQVRDGDELLKHAVLEVKVDQIFTPDGDDRIFIEVDRGGTLVDPDGRELELPEGSRYEERSVSDLRKAAPSGARLIVLAQPAPSDEEIEEQRGYHVLKHWSPAGANHAQLLSPIPQGLLFEDAESGYVSGVAEPADVQIGQWPAARGDDPAGQFQQLVDELTKEFG